MLLQDCQIFPNLTNLVQNIYNYETAEYNNINNKSDSKVIMNYVNRWVNILTIFLLLYLYE